MYISRSCVFLKIISHHRIVAQLNLKFFACCNLVFQSAQFSWLALCNIGTLLEFSVVLTSLKIKTNLKFCCFKLQSMISPDIKGKDVLLPKSVTSSDQKCFKFKVVKLLQGITMTIQFLNSILTTYFISKLDCFYHCALFGNVA